MATQPSLWTKLVAGRETVERKKESNRIRNSTGLKRIKIETF